MKPIKCFSSQPKLAIGAGLIEVLIAVLVLAIGLLGVAAMQAATLRNSESALSRSQGVIDTYTIIDAMRANAGVARSGGYNMGLSGSAPSGSDLAASDRAFWIATLKTNLGAGAKGLINCASTICTVEVHWNDERAGGAADQVYKTQVRI